MTRMLNVMERSEYINSPANEIREGAAEVRKNLRNGPSLARKQAVNNDMRAKGLTNSLRRGRVPYARQVARGDATV